VAAADIRMIKMEIDLRIAAHDQERLGQRVRLGRVRAGTLDEQADRAGRPAGFQELVERAEGHGVRSGGRAEVGRERRARHERLSSV
jgi:hypothetical protein